MTRLPGYAYDGPDPDGFMTAGEVVDFFAGLRRVVRRAGARAHHRPPRRTTTVTGFVVETDDGAVPRPQRRHRHRMVRPAAVPAAAAALSPRIHQVVPERVPQPRRPARRRRARGRRLGDRRAARPRAPPERPARHAGGRPPQPDAAPLPGHGHLLVARPDRRLRPHDRRGRRRRRRPATSRRCSSSAGPTRARSTWPRCRSTASASPDGCNAIDGERVDFGDRPRRHVVADADRRMRRVLDRIDDAIERLGARRRGARPRPLRPRRRRSTAPSSIDLAAAGITPSSGPPATAAATTGSTCRSSTRRGEIRQYRGVTPVAGRVRARPALPALPQLQLHRRRRPRRRVRRRPHLPRDSGTASTCPIHIHSRQN